MTVTLRGMTWDHPRGYGSVVGAARAYSRVAEVHIEWDRRSLQQFADLPLQELAESYDLLVLDHPHIPQAALGGLLAPLGGQGHDDELAVLASQSVGQSHASYAYGGQQYGLALDVATQVSAYRPDLISEPPADWQSVLELASTGRVLWPAKPIDAFASVVTVAANAGHEPMDAPGIFLGRDGLDGAIALLAELGRRVPSVNREWNPIQAADALSTSDEWAYCPLMYGYSNYSRVGFRRRRIAYTNIPSGARGVAGSMLGGAGVAVSASSPHKDVAIAHAFWLASAEVQKGVYFDGGGQPGNSEAWEDARINSQTLRFFEATRPTLEGAYVRPQWSQYLEFQSLASVLIANALKGGVSTSSLERHLNNLAERGWEATNANA